MHDMNPIMLKLGKASEWKLGGTDYPHPFHIHVNPFQTQRYEPHDSGGWQPNQVSLWKDTILLPNTLDGPIQYITIRSRYLRFTGRFVLHCQILGHEDSGMMDLVEITN